MMFVLSQASCMQKYKTPADTVKLDKEYAEVSNDIAELTSRLTVAQNELPVYESRAKAEEANAQNAATEASQQAAIARQGDLGHVKKSNFLIASQFQKKLLQNLFIVPLVAEAQSFCPFLPD